MAEAEAPKVGMSYRSQRTGRRLVVTALEGNQVYYEVEGFSTQAPLFLPIEKFLHLVGLDRKTD